tara:strand:- start:376 stop:786 length:411 start_codon:yes stop_codon:yes gene_type:complete
MAPNENRNTSFKKEHREVITSFSEQEMDSLFYETNMSCKDVLANFFYCNICFNNDANYLLSYNGKIFYLDSVEDPKVFTKNIVSLISSMKVGAEEYENFLNAKKNIFSPKEDEFLKHYFESQKKDSIIQSIKIQTH